MYVLPKLWLLEVHFARYSSNAYWSLVKPVYLSVNGSFRSSIPLNEVADVVLKVSSVLKAGWKFIQFSVAFPNFFYSEVDYVSLWSAFGLNLPSRNA